MKEIEKINNLENGAIIKLREKIKTFNDINEQMLINTFPEISIDSAKILCEKFTYT